MRERGNLLQRGSVRKTVNRRPKKPLEKYYINWFYPACAIVTGVVALILYLGIHADITTTQYRINKLNAEKVRLTSQAREVGLRIENLQSLERIEIIARRDLKMVCPKERMILSVKKSDDTAMDDYFSPPITSAYDQ